MCVCATAPNLRTIEPRQNIFYGSNLVSKTIMSSATKNISMYEILWPMSNRHFILANKRKKSSVTKKIVCIRKYCAQCLLFYFNEQKKSATATKNWYVFKYSTQSHIFYLGKE